jgi:hypothetical protein
VEGGLSEGGGTPEGPETSTAGLEEGNSLQGATWKEGRL